MNKAKTLREKRVAFEGRLAAYQANYTGKGFEDRLADAMEQEGVNV